MTVRELIEKLQALHNQGAQVVMDAEGCSFDLAYVTVESYVRVHLLDA